jgi:hypothetical protein
MIKYGIISKNRSSFLRIFGLSVSEFESIVERLEPLWEKNVSNHYKRPGRNAKLDVTGMTMALLMYYRHYVTQEFLGMLFDIDAATICRTIKRLEPLLLKIVALPKREGLKPDELHGLILDATENAIERPQQNQKLYYSGKKKHHTVKTEIRITPKGRITDVSKTVPGAVHDFELFKQGTPLPKETRAQA